MLPVPPFFVFFGRQPKNTAKKHRSPLSGAASVFPWFNAFFRRNLFFCLFFALFSLPEPYSKTRNAAVFGFVCIKKPSPFPSRRTRGAGFPQQSAPALQSRVISASRTATADCKTASVVRTCKPTRPPEKQISSERMAISSRKVGNCFFIPIGEHPPCT